MDLTCQLNAFQSLDNRKKTEMMTNVSLKDEIILQNIGIANLSARLVKQSGMISDVIQHSKLMEAKVGGLHFLDFYLCCRLGSLDHV